MIKHDAAITLVRMRVAIGAVLATVSAGSAQSQRAAIDRGLARLRNATGFVKANMPLGRGATLRQPRPDFPAKTRDWPKGGKPDDAPY